MNLSRAFIDQGYHVTVVAQSVDETHFGRMTHIIRERLAFAPFVHDGVSVVQFRPSRRRRALPLPFAAELIPLGGRVSRRWLPSRQARRPNHLAATRPPCHPPARLTDDR